MDFKMKYITLNLFLLFFIVTTASEFRQYCYNDPELNCTEKHVLDCKADQVITTDISSFSVSFLKNRNFPECRTNAGECKNKTTCCRFISSSVTRYVTGLSADNTSNPVIDFIKTNCSSKTSCTVDYYNNNGGPGLYDYVTYRYGCISIDEVTVDFMVNGSTKFTGNNFRSIYYLDYTGIKGDNNVILNRECVVSTTKRSMILTIKKLNLQADDCCRFQITGFDVFEYWSESGSLVPLTGKYIDRNIATIKLENVTYKDGDKFSILIQAAGNVTVECKTIEDVDKQEISICQYPTPQSTTTIRTSTPTTSISTEATATDGKDITITDRKEADEQGTSYSESELAVIIGGIVGGLVFLNIIFIIIIVVCVRKKLEEKINDESQYYATLDDSRRSTEYVDMTTTSTPTRG